MGVLIEAKGLGRNFGEIQAVRGVSFSVQAGDVLGFLGPNGAGKSTTMKMLSCFLEPSFGTAEVAGYDICSHSKEVRSHLGYLPENAPLYTEMKVGEFLSFVAEVRGISGAARTAAITAAVDRTSLGTVFEQRIETLSKGFRRRVGLAQALLHDPEILILDEPTDGLDPNQKHEVRSLIKEMRDKCIILSTHILEEVDAVCNRAVIVSQGAIVADDTPEGLRSRAREGAHVRYTVSSGPADAVETFLASLPGVRSLKRQNRLDTTVFSVEAESGVSLDSRIFFEESLRRNWGLSEFTAFDGGLDAVFREITQSSGQRSE